jgi:hypothetical protein
MVRAFPMMLVLGRVQMQGTALVVAVTAAEVAMVVIPCVEADMAQWINLSPSVAAVAALPLELVAEP